MKGFHEVNMTGSMLRSYLIVLEYSMELSKYIVYHILITGKYNRIRNVSNILWWVIHISLPTISYTPLYVTTTYKRKILMLELTNLIWRLGLVVQICQCNILKNLLTTLHPLYFFCWNNCSWYNFSRRHNDIVSLYSKYL